MLAAFLIYRDLLLFILGCGFLVVCAYGVVLLRKAVRQDAERLRREGQNHVEKKAKPIV